MISRALMLLLVGFSVTLGQVSREDPVTELINRIGRGEASLEFDKNLGYLPGLLKQLGVNIDSQVLVFSKTSLQRDHISPASPRAVYFSDDVAVGSVHGGELIELISVPPQGRLRFFSLDVYETDHPRLQAETSRCGVCHGPAGGMTISSVFADSDGTYLSGIVDYVDHRTPLDIRWGGWYVTGTHGRQEHMGNVISSQNDNGKIRRLVDMNVTSLADRFDTSKYLAPTSDIVALMTLEHQARMTNLILGASERSINELVDYMLFIDEAPLAEPVAGVSSFTRTFAARGPRDHHGRSLREFELRKRLFRYPLSYMIYSDAFTNVKPTLRKQILARINAILVGQETNPKYNRLSSDDRRAILEIARETVSDFPGAPQ